MGNLNHAKGYQKLALDIRGSVHLSTTLTEKIQQDATVYQNYLYYLLFYMKLNMFRATHRPSSGA